MPYDYPIRFGKYYLTRRIAVGGMAEVFKAKLVGIKGFEKTLAVKKILPEYNEDEEFVQMFVDEARISSNLHHNNIVQVYDFGRAEQSYYIAMEFLDGTNLKNLLQRNLKNKGPLPKSICYYILMQVARALDYAHNVQINEEKVLNLVHRDVSPQNVLVSRSGEIKITDFGIAKAAIKLSKTQPGKIQGKFSYMSPEQAAGKPIDRRSDIFSLGIIAYELFSGLKMYSQEDTQQKYKEVRDAKIGRLGSIATDLPSEVESLVMQMLSKDPNDRPQTCAEIVSKFGDFLSDISVNQLTSDLGLLVEELFPKERSDPAIVRRLNDMVARDTSEPTLPAQNEPIETSQKKSTTVVIHTDSGDETTIDHWPGIIWESKLGRGALFSFGLALLAIALFFFQTKPPTPNTTLLENSKPIPGETTNERPATNTPDEATTKLKELEQKYNTATKELKQAEKKLEIAETNDRTARLPPKPCPSDMVLIPAGTFYFGSDKNDPLRNDAVEFAASLISNSRFCIDRYEFPSDKGVTPKTKVSWTEAQTLCAKEKERLCTQEEWERACKGSADRGNLRFPYGKQFDSQKCNTEKKNPKTGEFSDRDLSKTGSYPGCVSPDGAFDLSGNVDEWTSTPGHYSQGTRVTKGGSFKRPDWASRCSSFREINSPEEESDLGFRCCKDAL